MRRGRACIVLFLNVGVLLARPSLQGQAPAGRADALTFEVASVKPNKSGDWRQGLGPAPGGGFAATNVTLKDLIPYAYGLPQLAASTRIIGGPKWIDRDRFDINAKTAAPAVPQELGQMLRALLTERFKLRADRETRNLAIYALVVTKKDRSLGPGLRRSEYQEDYCNARRAAVRANAPTPPGPSCGSGRAAPGHISGTSWTLDQLSNTLVPFASRVVRDETGLTGRFDLDLTWTPDTPLPGPPDDRKTARIDPNGPPLVTALPEQLGLRLENRRAPLDVVVIDSADAPTPD